MSSITNRPVYMPSQRYPYCDIWNAQLANFKTVTSAERAQMNIRDVFRVFEKRFPDKRVLEVSLYSLQEPLGRELCPQYLKKYVPSLNAAIPMESLFHGSKVFQAGGPYTDLYTTDPFEAKNDPRLKNSGILNSYCFEKEDYPNHPRTAFFDFMYMLALVEPQNYELTKQLLQYDAFTDITYQETRDFVCPARSITIFVSLMRMGLLQKVHTFDEYLTVIQGTNEGNTTQMRTQAVEFNVGDVVVHPSWGKGRIIATEPKLVVRFPSVGEKNMNPSYVKENCEIVPAE